MQENVTGVICVAAWCCRQSFPVKLAKENGLLSGIADLFEDGAAMGKGVLEVTGRKAVAFCDDLIKNSKTEADVYPKFVDQEVNKAMLRIQPSKTEI